MVAVAQDEAAEREERAHEQFISFCAFAAAGGIALGLNWAFLIGLSGVYVLAIGQQLEAIAKAIAGRP